MYQPAASLMAPREPCQKNAAVVVVEDDRRVCIPASDHVVHRPGGIDPRLTRHPSRMAWCAHVRQMADSDVPTTNRAEPEL
jgi:hypothetical protein